MLKMTNECPQAMLFRDKHHGVSVGHFSWGMIYWWFRKGGVGGGNTTDGKCWILYMYCLRTKIRLWFIDLPWVINHNPWNTCV